MPSHTIPLKPSPTASVLGDRSHLSFGARMDRQPDHRCGGEILIIGLHVQYALRELVSYIPFPWCPSITLSACSRLSPSTCPPRSEQRLLTWLHSFRFPPSPPCAPLLSAPIDSNLLKSTRDYCHPALSFQIDEREPWLPRCRAVDGTCETCIKTGDTCTAQGVSKPFFLFLLHRNKESPSSP